MSIPLFNRKQVCRSVQFVSNPSLLGNAMSPRVVVIVLSLLTEVVFMQYFFIFLLVDLVNDAAIRHENGKQVARWNVDIYGNGEEQVHNSASAASVSSSVSPPSSTAYVLPHHMPMGAPHPATVSGSRYNTTNGQIRHPNGKFIMPSC